MARPAAGMILAAGFGTRLKPLSDRRPKPLMEIANKAIIYYLINNLINSGVEDIYINLYYEYQQIITAINNMKFDANINFSIEENILGTAGGVRRVIEKFHIKNRELVLINGDIWCEFEIKNLLGRPYFANLVCAVNRSVDGYEGSVAIDNENHITELGRYYKSDKPSIEKGFFTGLQVLSAEALELLESTTKSCLVSEVYPQWLKEGKKLNGHMAELCYEDLGSPARILKANSAMLSRSKSSVLVDKSALIEDQVEFGPHVSIGAHCHVKSGAKIKDSVVMSGTTIEKDERLDCAIALLDARVFMKGTSS